MILYGPGRYKALIVRLASSAIMNHCLNETAKFPVHFLTQRGFEQLQLRLRVGDCDATGSVKHFLSESYDRRCMMAKNVAIGY